MAFDRDDCCVAFSANALNLIDGNAANSMRTYYASDMAWNIFAGTNVQDTGRDTTVWARFEGYYDGASSHLRYNDATATLKTFPLHLASVRDYAVQVARSA